MKVSKIIKQGIMIALFVFLSLKSQSTHVNAQEKTRADAKQMIEQQLFGKDGKTSIDVSQYDLEKSDAKQIVTKLQKDYGTTGLIKCTYQTDDDGTVQTIKVQTDESLKSVIKEVNELEEDTSDDNNSTDTGSDGDTGEDTDESQEQLKQQVISDYAELQKYYEANPDYFGVAVPYFTDKDTEETPLGAIIELADLDKDNLDLNQVDQTIVGMKNGLEMYVQYYGEDLLKIKDEMLAKTDDKMSEIEKLLVVHDALARLVTFDTDYLEPDGNGGGGFLSSTIFGALNNKKAICLGYAAAYGYLVQNMYPDIYKHSDGTWKTKEEVGDDYMIDYAKYLKGNPHYMNVIKLNGNWYYLDPSFDDIKIDQIVCLRTQTDGNCSHKFFLYTEDNLETWLNLSSSAIDSAYKEKCTDTTYSKEWYKNISSEISYDDDSWYFVKPQVIPEEQVSGILGNHRYIDKKDQLVLRNRESGDTSVLIDYETGAVYDKDGNQVDTSEEIKEEYVKDIGYNKVYPELQHSVSLYNGSLYFNLGNKIYRYSLKDASVTKIKEYNKLYIKKDESISPIREGFFLTDKDGDNTNLNFVERPIAGISIKDDGLMYVALATNLSGSYSYESEASNYTPYYSHLGESNAYNKQFKKCANVKETIDMAHLDGDDHEYETVEVDPTCLRKGFTEERCKVCGRVKEGTYKETSDEVDHHYVYDSNAKKYRCSYCNQVTSEAKEHKYDQRPQFTWSDDKKSCEASFVCSVCGHVETVKCQVTVTVIKKSNCLEEGIEQYIAECTFQGNSYNDSRAKMLPKLAKKVSLEKKTMSLYITEGKKLVLVSNYPNDTIKTLKASKSGIVRIKGTQIYGVKSGKVVITVTTKSKVTLKCTVTVKKPSITVSKKSLTLVAKNTYKLAVSKKISSDAVSKWTSSNKKIATVDKNGKVTAKAKGTCYITVKMKSGASAKVKVIVQKRVLIKTLKANATKVILEGVDKTYQLTIKKTPVKANETITYKTSNSKIATVNSQGKITAKGVGTCVITITGGKKKVQVTVTVKELVDAKKKK